MAMKEVISLECTETAKLGSKTEEGELGSIRGYYLGSKKVPNDLDKKGYSFLHIFRKKGAAGNTGVWGSSKLDELLADVMRGALTEVTFTGDVKIRGGKQKMKTFTVRFDDEDVMEGAPATTVDSTSPAVEDSSEDVQEDIDTDEAEALLNANS